MFVSVSQAQEANKTPNPAPEKTAKCVPTKECAEKMGITLEECKKLCAKKCAAKTTTTTAVASASDSREMVNLTGVDKKVCCAGKKDCCSSIEECAKKMGMTVEECKAKCKNVCTKASSKTGEIKTAVASSVMEKSDVETKGKTKACSNKKACCKKKK